MFQKWFTLQQPQNRITRRLHAPGESERPQATVVTSYASKGSITKRSSICPELLHGGGTNPVLERLIGESRSPEDKSLQTLEMMKLRAFCVGQSLAVPEAQNFEFLEVLIDDVGTFRIYISGPVLQYRARYSRTPDDAKLKSFLNRPAHGM